MSSESAVCFISLCGGVGRAEMSVCVYGRPKSAVRRIGSRALPLICAHRTMYCRPSRNRGVEGCAAAAGLSASAEAETQACAARTPARRPAGRRRAGPCKRTERIGALLSPVGAKACPLHIWNAAMRAAFPKSRRARTQLAFMCGKMRHRLPLFYSEKSDCEAEASEPIPPEPFARFGATYRKRRGRKRQSGFRCEQKSVCGAQPQTLIVHPFFFASR